MQTLHFAIIVILLFALTIPSIDAQNGTMLEENMTVSRHSAHVMYPTVNVTRFMSIAENSTEFKDKINGYAHHVLGTLVITPKSYPQNTGNTTLEYNLVYDLYKNDNDCTYAKVLIVTLNVHLKVVNATEYLPYGVPKGYPLPAACLAGVMPWKMQMNPDGLAGTMPWTPPLQQLHYGILAKNVSCINGQILVLKSEDGSPACVRPDTAQILAERGWAIDANPLSNDTGTIMMGNQTYYFETPRYSQDAYANSPQISFHGVIFTLFPTGFRGGLPAIHCGLQGSGLGQYYWADSKFSDNTHELLHLFAYSPLVCNLPIPSMLSNHTKPQAGLIFYDGKMKLLVSTDVDKSGQEIGNASSQPVSDSATNPLSTERPIYTVWGNYTKVHNGTDASLLAGYDVKFPSKLPDNYAMQLAVMRPLLPAHKYVYLFYSKFPISDSIPLHDFWHDKGIMIRYDYNPNWMHDPTYGNWTGYINGEKEDGYPDAHDVIIDGYKGWAGSNHAGNLEGWPIQRPSVIEFQAKGVEVQLFGGITLDNLTEVARSIPY